MEYLVPDYYNEFACIADKCPDSCCAGWQIMIDAKSLAKYKKYPGSLGNRLHNSIDWKEGSFLQYKHRCAFLNEDNLCDLYREAGADMLCKTCQSYPRHVEEFENLREISLSLSCPEAARILLTRKEPVRFLRYEKPSGEEEYADFDYLLFTLLQDARNVCFAILQNRKHNIWTRISMVLSLSHDLQRRIRSGNLFEVDALLQRYQKPGAAERFEQKLALYRGKEQEKKALTKAAFSMLLNLEVLKHDWPEFIQKRAQAVLQNDVWVRGAQEEPVILEQLMVYFVYTYFCGAVYDEDVYTKMKQSVLNTYLIYEIYHASALLENREVRMSDVIEAAYRLDREVEHSEENMKRVEECLRGEKTFRLEKLLLLLNA